MPSIVWIMVGTLLLVLTSVSVAASILSSMISRQEEHVGEPMGELTDVEGANEFNPAMTANLLVGEQRLSGGLQDRRMQANLEREPIKSSLR